MGVTTWGANAFPHRVGKPRAGHAPTVESATYIYIQLKLKLYQRKYYHMQMMDEYLMYKLQNEIKCLVIKLIVYY